MNKEYMLAQFEKLISIPSPTGYTSSVEKYTIECLKEMGYNPVTPHKGGVICELGGQGEPLMFAAHLDTLGAAIKTIKSNGRIKVTPIGGLNANNVEAETVKVITRFNGEYEGTFQLENASLHVNSNYNVERNFDKNLEIVLDEDVKTVDDVNKLGIENGDIISVSPRFRVTDSGYIKTRFIDDKASGAILLAVAKAVKDGTLKLNRKVYLNFTVYEEVGHGSSYIPSCIDELLAIDMGCIGLDLTCTEMDVSICAKDSSGPYDYEMVSRLVSLSKELTIPYAVDIYPMYGSDVSAALRGGQNIRGALIGPGVHASHGMERTHSSAMLNTVNLILSYIEAK